MRKVLLFVFAVSAINFTYAQNLYFNTSMGVNNYMGDLKLKNFPKERVDPAFSIGASYSFLPGTYVNLTYTGAKIYANDQTSGINGRNLNFYTNIQEGSITFERDLLPRGRNTPYVFAGVAVFHYNPYTYVASSAHGTASNNKVYLQPLGTEGQGLPQYPGRQKYNLWQMAIPFGVGCKRQVSARTTVGMEFGFRKLFTDYLDDVSRFHYADTAILRQERGEIAAKVSFRADELPGSTYPISAQRGNPNKNDAYYTFQFRVSYKIGSINRFKTGY